MRRFICATLLVSLCLQSTGAAATPLSGAPNVGITLAQPRLDFQNAINWLIWSPMFAMVLSPERYAAMHAPRPAHVIAVKSEPRNAINRGLVRPFSHGAGMRGTSPEMLNRPLLPKDAEKLHPPTVSGANLRAASSVHAPILDIPIRAPIQVRAAAPRSSRIHQMTVTVGSTNTTGINPWWTYAAGLIPGVGKYMVNVANGNLLVQSTDVDVPERGIDLAFQRTYNSLSQNDWNGSGGNDDGSSSPNVFGAGWTNTFGAHLGLNDAGGISVFDVDGARYDYAPSGSGCLTPPPGMHSSLCTDGNLGYYWTKKTGTVYYFWRPDLGALYPVDAGYAGRLYIIYGRNNNNNISLIYSWLNGDSSTSANLTQIVAAHSDGQALTLAFGAINGKVLLSSITRPDGQQITYWYPNPGSNNPYSNLEEVDRPGNNQGTLQEQYGYYSSNGFLNWVSSPRWFMTGGAQGAYDWFNYDGSNRLSGVQLFGYSNFVPSDGTSTALQSGYSTGYQQIAYTGFTFPSGSETSMSDVDGHATNWFFDGPGRVTQTQEWSGSLWLITNASWDSNNSVTETVDARGNTTDFAHDPNGNTTAVALPQITTAQGTFRPTNLYSYDANNNITATCDPVETHSLGEDWTGNPGTSDSLCPFQSGASRYSWTTSSSNPKGDLTDSYTPLGYHRSVQYNAASQGGDFSLPTDVVGDCMTQTDGNSRCPHQSFTYTGTGSVLTSGTGSGTWSFSYDSLNRLTNSTDPDGVVSRICYYSNGQISARQSALQYQLDGGTVCGSNSVSYTYDDDGNKLSETHHNGNVTGVTTKWYDGASRLVEVRLPSDSHDVFQNSWTTRYLYDLSESGTVSISGSSTQYYSAHGNLFKTQELLMPGTSQQLSWYSGQSQLVNSSFQDTKGTAYDALDRAVTRYQFVGDNLSTESFSYDTSANTYGQLSQHCNALNVCGNLSYDSVGHAAQVSYTDGTTPTESMTYDASGQLASINSSVFGTQTYAFDADGRKTQSIEPTGGGVTSPATILYHYYGDGTRSSLDVSSSALNQTSLFAYSYRADGLIEQKQINLSSDSQVGNSALTYTYSSAGRFTHRAESGPAANGTATAASYDSNNGTMATLNYPSAGITGFSYDAEGELLGYQEAVNNGNNVTRSFAYTSRGEQNLDSRQSASSTNYANGVPIAGSSSTNTLTWSARAGVATGVNRAPEASDFVYDAAGRQARSDVYGADSNGDTYDIAKTRQYDAEDRLISGSQASPKLIRGIYAADNNTLTAYRWGPNGHLIQVGSTPVVLGNPPSTSQLAYDTLHWDGDQLLFTTNSQGQLNDVKIGASGDITPLDAGYAGLTFWDRLAGTVAFCHNATGAAGSDTLSANKTNLGSGCTLAGQTMQIPTGIVWSGGSQLAGGIGQGKLMGMPGSDGLADGTNILQGIRAYDPQQGGWTTPDPYPGDPDAPISQKSYLWNGNNAVANSDPSGFDITSNPAIPPLWIPPDLWPKVPPGTDSYIYGPGNFGPQDWFADLKAIGIGTAIGATVTKTFLGALVGAATSLLAVMINNLTSAAPTDLLYFSVWYNGHGGRSALISYTPGTIARNMGCRSFTMLVSSNWTGSETVTLWIGNQKIEHHYGPGHSSKGYVSDMQADAMNGAYSGGESTTGGTTIVGGYNNVTPW